jgi:hypothetical protein
MSNGDAFPIIFFMLSFFAFGVLILYALAKAWEKALSGHKDTPRPTAFNPGGTYES